jgi:ABC-type transport system substrate-binding protein
MSNSYWNKILDGRVSRRRAIAATGAGALGAAFLAACGGSDSGGGTTTTTDSNGTPQASSMVTKYEDSSKSAKRGGTMKWLATNEPLHFDGSAQGQVQLNVLNGLAYSGLVSNKPGIGAPSTWTEVVGDLAQSWEFAPDGLQLTFKLRDGVKWHNKAPVNGRAFDSSDVVETFTRWSTGARASTNNAGASANSVNPSAPILSVNAPDAKTVVFKLKDPTSFILQRFANLITGELGAILPKETDKGFDPRKDQLGTGAYMLDKYEPSVRLTYKRNPDYWNKDAGFPDQIDIPFIPTSQYPAQLAQVQTGAVYAIPLTGGLPGIQATDVVTLKKSAPALNMYQYVPATNSPGAVVGFGFNPGGGQKSPWNDVRVRQALSMSFDREAYIDTFGNVSAFAKDGLAVDTHWFTSIAYIPGVTLDPRKSDFGENAKYYKRDIGEAKKLLVAAGYTDGFEYPSHFVGSGNFGPAYPKQVEVMDQFARDIGLKPKADPIDYNLKYLPNYILTRGKHDGIVYRIGAVTSPSPVDFFVWRYQSSSTTSGALGFDVNGLGDGKGDPTVDSFIDKAKLETDSKKQVAILGDLQRYLAKMQYSVTNPGTADTFLMAWPALRNYATFQGDSRAINDYYYTWWLDETQAPFKKS